MGLDQFFITFDTTSEPSEDGLNTSYEEFEKSERVIGYFRNHSDLQGYFAERYNCLNPGVCG